VDSLHVKRIAIEDLMGYACIVRVDKSIKSNVYKKRNKLFMF
jgi:hypothetical protein